MRSVLEALGLLFGMAVFVGLIASNWPLKASRWHLLWAFPCVVVLSLLLMDVLEP